MKKLITLAGLAVVVGLAAFSTIFIEDEIVVTNERKVATTTVEVQVVDQLEERIKEAQEAAKADIEKAAERAYNALYEEKMKEVEDSVKKEYISEIEASITSESY